MCGAGVHYCVDPGLADLISSYGPIRGPHQVFPIREVYLNGHTTHRLDSLTNHGVPLLVRSPGRLTDHAPTKTEAHPVRESRLELTCLDLRHRLHACFGEDLSVASGASPEHHLVELGEIAGGGVEPARGDWILRALRWTDDRVDNGLELA